MQTPQSGENGTFCYHQSAVRRGNRLATLTWQRYTLTHADVSVASIHETARGFCFGSFCFDADVFVIGDGQNRHLNSLHTADSYNPGNDPPVNLARPESPVNGTRANHKGISDRPIRTG